MNAAAPSPDFHDDPDVQKMLRVRDGDMQALEELVRDYADMLRTELTQKHAFKKDDAEDICQLVFIKVFNTRESYTPKSTFKVWIFNLLYYEIRKRKENKRRSGHDYDVVE